MLNHVYQNAGTYTVLVTVHDRTGGGTDTVTVRVAVGAATPPSVDITDVAPDPRRIALSTMAIVFNKPVSGFDRADLRLTRDGGTDLLTAAQTLTVEGDGVTYTLGNLSSLTAAEGTYTLTLVAAGSGISDSQARPLAAGASDTFLVDRTAPTGAAPGASFDPAAAAPPGSQAPSGPKVRFTFSEDVSGSLVPQDVSVRRLSDATGAAEGEAFSPEAVAYDAATHTATFTFASPLPNGNYRAVLPASAAADAAGNPLAGDYVLDFFALTGDINRDRRVDGSDFALLAGNFGKTGVTYGQGDLNGDGAVNGSDFALLAGNFGKTVPAPQASLIAAASAPAEPAKADVPTRRAPSPAPVRRRPAPPRVRQHVAAEPVAAQRGGVRRRG